MRLNLQNKTLTVAINSNAPYTFLRLDDEKNEWFPVGGSEIHLLETLSVYFNFTYEMVNCRRNYGRKNPNGTWSGLIGLLMEQQADFGIGGVSMNYDRSKAVSFLYPHQMDQVTFTTSAPSMTEYYSHFLIEPFQSSVWHSFILCISICIILDRIIKNYDRKTDLLWASLVLLLRQPRNIRTNVSNRAFLVWIICWNIGMFILTTAYAGCFYSLIAVPEIPHEIDSVLELYHEVQSNEMIVTTVANSLYSDIVKNFPLDIGKNSREVIDAKDGFRSILKNKQTPHFAFIAERKKLLYHRLISGEKFFYIPPEGFDSSLFLDILSVPVKPNFPYIKEFDSTTKRLTTIGLFDYWNDREYQMLKKSNVEIIVVDKFSRQTIAFELIHLKSLYIVYIIGLSAATSALLFEIVWKLIFLVHI
ncbi:hypothetical protein BLA29_000855 [Euroglyphus maynei]|uniref:Ionotropic glutamate receptor L-glutamate and glycine-binding domain-containing protein n=1 Tax=Euroglyphus maynei TaxID=6958 RepID=A0A1Y3AVY3_EURMA|nr:hypothetical protein BLA29_000855 [Euroglyphus maynei]